jgi:TonB family protein
LQLIPQLLTMVIMGSATRRAAVETGDLVDGRYRILSLLGEGGMGSVFLAEHTLIKRKVAIKILHPQLAREAHVVDCFMNEARAAGLLGHPNIVESTDMGFTHDHVPYIVLEYLQGALLTDEIYRVGGLPVRRAVRIAEQIADALRAAHDAKLVHRDLKSDNIFLTDKDDASDHVKVLDFGVSRFMHVEDGHSTTVVGTPEFMSPEQLTAPETVDHRADIYALGVILYEMLSARRPFNPGKTPDELGHTIISSPPPPLQHQKIPRALADLIIDRLLAKDPAARPQSMGEVGAALEAFLTREDGTPVPRRRTQPIAVVVSEEDAALDSLTIPKPHGMLNTPWPTRANSAAIVGPSRANHRPVALIAVASAGLVVGAIGLVFGLRGHHEPTVQPTPAPIAQTQPAASLPPTAREPLKVQVIIDTDVANAHVVFRRRVASAPMTTEIAASDIVELVEVSAQGYKTERYWLTLDRGTHLKAHLVKGNGMDEASEEDTLVALGEIAATPTGAAPSHDSDVASGAMKTVHQPEAAKRVAIAPRRIGRAAARESQEQSRELVSVDSPANSPVIESAPVAVAEATPTKDSVAPPAMADDKLALPEASQSPAPAMTPPAPEAPAVARAQPAPAIAEPAVTPPANTGAAPITAAAPKLVAPSVLKALRTSTETQIDPPDSVHEQMIREEHKVAQGVVKVCINDTGAVTSTSVMKSTGYATYDQALAAGVHNWHYKPYLAAGHASAVCSAVTFVYKLQ